MMISVKLYHLITEETTFASTEAKFNENNRRKPPERMRGKNVIILGVKM